jgi:lipoprotein-anchoring transpeptidase ErfK/SrfK
MRSKYSPQLRSPIVLSLFCILLAIVAFSTAFLEEAWFSIRETELPENLPATSAAAQPGQLEIQVFDNKVSLSNEAAHNLKREAGSHESLPGEGPESRQPDEPETEVRVVVDLKALNLTLYLDGKATFTYPIAIGKSKTPTPMGEFKVIDKKKDPGGPFGSRWIGLNIPWGIYGIHGTNRPGSIGNYASAGCIRMHNHHVAELFDYVPIGTEVIIKGNDLSTTITRTLKPGITGEDVQFAQQHLRRMGYDAGPLDGYFGPLFRSAVMEMQAFYGVPKTGEIGDTELYVMGLK